MKWDKETELLEAQFNKRGLQFTSPFEGLSLMQAYGFLDGKRFYFHLRHGNASLCVGIYDKAAELKRIRRNEGTSPQPAQGHKKGLQSSPIPKETDLNLFPSVVLLTSRVESHQQKLVDVFSALVDTLKPVENTVSR